MDSKGYLLIPLKAELLSVDLKAGEVRFRFTEPPQHWKEEATARCPERRRFLAAMADLQEKSGRNPLEGTALIWPASDEEARWVLPAGCWVHCFEPGHELPEYEEVNIRIIGEVLVSEGKRLLLRLADGSTAHVLTPSQAKGQRGRLSFGRIATVLLNSRRLYNEGILEARKIGEARGKARLEFLRLRSLLEKPNPALQVEGSEEFAINYGDVVLVYGQAKAGKTRALLALFADSEPQEKGLRIERQLRAIGNPTVYYMSHITETPLPRLRAYAEKLGWNPERAEAYLYPFEEPKDLEEFLMDDSIPDKSFVVVDSLVKLFPRNVTGESENDAVQVEKTLTPLIQAARKRGHLLIFIHHQPKNSSSPRGSTAIQALPDHILHVNEIRRGRAPEYRLQYERGRTTRPSRALLTITEEAPEPETPLSEEVARRNRKAYGRRPKYEPILRRVFEEMERRGECQTLPDESGIRRCFFKEEAIIQKLMSAIKQGNKRNKRKAPDTRINESDLREMLKRYAGMGRNARKHPFLDRIEMDGHIYYAAREEEASSKVRSSRSKSAGRKSS